MKVMRVFGIDVKINFLLCGVFAVFFLFGYIENILISFLVVLFHEGSHCFMANLLGYRIENIELFPFGGVARIQGSIGIYPIHEIIIAVIGPISNLVLSFIGYHVLDMFHLYNEYLVFFVYTNLIIGLFNLLPILPLDGGRIIRSYLAHFIGFKKATKIVVYISKIISGIIFLWGCYIMRYNRLNGLILCMAIFLYVAAHKELRMAAFIFMKEITQKNQQVLSKGILVTKHLTALGSTSIKNVMDEFVPRKYHMVTVIDDTCHVMGSLTEKELIDGSMKYGLDVTLEKLLIGK